MTTLQNINLAITVQEGAVVSKEIISKATGTVTLFAFDKGQGLSEHAAPYDALAIVTEGAAEITVSKVTHEVKTHDMVLMPAGAPHAVKASQPFKMILIMIK